MIKHASNWNLTSILVVVLFSCFIFAQVAQAQSDVHFDSGSKSLAKTWQQLKGSLPHKHIPNNTEEVKDVGSWAMDYGVGIAKIVGPGVAIAILSVVVGLLYGIFKILRMCCRCCCGKSSDSDEDSDTEDSQIGKDLSWNKKWCPTIFYAIFFVFLLTGMAFALANNPRFTQGIDDMGDSVISVGSQAINLGNGIYNNVSAIVALVPETIDTIQDQFEGVDPLGSEVVDLSADINATSIQVNGITTEVGKIDAGNTSALANLYKELSDINNSSDKIISQMSDLTYQIAQKLHNTFNNTIGTLDEKVADIDSTVDDLQSTAQDIIKQAADLVDKVIKYVNDGKSYDKSRRTALMAFFVVIVFIPLGVIPGFIFKKKPIFNIVAAISFPFLFILWISGSIHFLFGMVLYDACPVIDPTVQGLLPQDSQAASVLNGCLYEHRSVLDSLNISAYNLSDVFDYKSDLQEFANFSSGFNFSAIDSYFNSITHLYAYNLTAIADNITLANFGWNETVVYTALNSLNNATYPDVFDLQNYTNCDPNQYSNKNAVKDRKIALNDTVVANATIYNKMTAAKNDLYAAQYDINYLTANMTLLQSRYNDVKTTINTLETQNITNCLNALDNLQANITAFFELGNCSFLGDAFSEIKGSMCDTMQPAIDNLTFGQFLAGIALIPLIILAEVLSFRIPKSKDLNILHYDDDDDNEYYDEEKAYKKTQEDSQFKYGNSRNAGISATISAEPPTNSSPDFNGRRKTIAEHFENNPHTNEQ